MSEKKKKDDNPTTGSNDDPAQVSVKIDTTRIDKQLKEVQEKIEALEKKKAESTAKEAKTQKDEASKKLEEEFESLKTQLGEIEKTRAKEIKEAEEKLTKATEAKTTTEEQLEDLKAKLELISEREYAKKKEALMEKVKGVIKDEEQIKMVEEQLEDPEKIEGTMKWVDVLEKNLSSSKEAIVAELVKKGKEFEIEFDEEKIKDDPKALKKLEDAVAEAEEKKRKEEQAAKTGTGEGAGAAGTAGLTTGQKTGKSETAYETYGAMIRDLRRRERAGDEEATRILNEFFLKWAKNVGGTSAKMLLKEHIPPKQEKITPSDIFYRDPRKKKKGD